MSIAILAYINDLPDSLKSSDARLFADDSLLYLTVNGAKGNNQFQEDLLAMEEWERVWQMSFNPSKWSIIRITSGKKKQKNVFQSTVVPVKSDSDVMFCLQSYQALRIDGLLVY